MKFFILAFVLLMASPIFSQTPPPVEPGVSRELARWRAANYSDVRYKLNLTLEKNAPLMKGEIEIRVNLTEEGAKNDLILDWRTTPFQNDKDKPYANVISVNATGAQASLLAVSAKRENKAETSENSDVLSPSTDDDASRMLALQSNEHLIIPQKFLKKGENVIKINFASPVKTSGAAVTRYVDKEDGAEYVYSLFVPSDASTAFPVFDQPDLKARFELNVKVPYGWKVISNSAEEDFSGTFLDENRKPAIQLVHFEVTKPISPYVFAFAAGEFEEFRGKRANIDDNLPSLTPPNLNESLDTRRIPLSRASATNIYVRKSQVEKFKAHEKEVFRLNSEAVKYLETYFDYKFPFPKYDLVLIPEFPFGGMEHAGATFLREDRIIFPTEPTKNDFVTRANLIFHEAAHQWFGDTVTMKWFDDLWLKEGFAEFMAYKTLEKVMPEYNAWKIFYERNKQAAYLTDSTRGTTPIYQEIPNLSAAKSAYGNIVYRKAPSFLKQAEFYLGEKEFQTAVRAFLKKHEFANAEWTDLVKEFETASKQDLKDWANSWVKKRGLPIIRFNINQGYTTTSDCIGAGCGNGRGVFPEISLKQENEFKEQGFWQMKIKVFYQSANENSIKDVVLSKPESSSPIFLEKMKYEKGKKIYEPLPKFVFPNYQDYGYGIFLLDEKSRAYVLENIQNEKDDFLRTMMWGSLWDSVREAELAPRDYVELVIKNLSVESDESTIQTLLGRVSTAMSYYLSDKQREELAPKLEAVLIEKMRNAPTLGQRITFYRAFLNLASSNNARTVLKDILSGKFKIQNLELKTKDKFDILARLLILGEAASPLLQELAKTERSDDARRYAYGAQAGIATAQNKKEFYEDFVNNPAIPESWIEAAFAPFNSVRHSDLTLPYLEKALAELPNLKRNRKIFFVNGWLGAFIGGQKSAEALKIVNNFLEKNPDLDRDLRLKILENSDNLERAVKIREKFAMKN